MPRLTLLPVICLVALVAACGSDDEAAVTTSPPQTEPATVPASDAPAPVQLDETTRTATVADGGTVELTIGEVNASIGDAWSLTNVEPPGSVTLIDERYEGSECPEAGAGCSQGTLIWTLQVDGDGTVTFAADNCYRGACPDDPNPEDGTERREYTLTVAG